MMQHIPRVGVGVLILRDGRLLLGKRKNSHGDECWAPPGGHLEFGESIFECAKREVFEETGIQIAHLKQGPYSNDVFHGENKHYVSLFVVADYRSGAVELKEPEKCHSWEWFDKAKLPTPLFLPLSNILAQGYQL